MSHHHTWGETVSAHGAGLRTKRDPDEQFWGIIGSTTRVYDKYKSGKFSEDDYQTCLEANSKAVNMTPEELNAFIEKLSEPIEAEDKNPEINNETDIKSL